MQKKNLVENPWRDCPQPEPTYIQEISRRYVESIRTALLEHKRIGNSIAVWENGAVRIVPADQIDDLLARDNPSRSRKSKHKATA